MSDLFWPGDERAGDLMSDMALLSAMVRVESAWLASLVNSGIAPSSARRDLADTVSPDDISQLSREAESSGNPVIPLLHLIRARVDGETAGWVHRGLTSQDVLDTALMLATRDVLDVVLVELRRQITALSALAHQHTDTPMVGRTLTQHALPTTFGAVVSAWLDGVLDAADLVIAARTSLPVQLGGAVGTLAAPTELGALSGQGDGRDLAADLVTQTSDLLGLSARRPWHTSRGPVTRTADAMVSCTDSWAHIATDVATLSRSEIGELSEPVADGRGGSSAMPHKHNPVLSVLLRRTGLAAPALVSTLHLASAAAGDQRSDGAWHTEWATLRTLARRTAVAASQATELLNGLSVDTARMRSTLHAASDDVLSERRALGELLGVDVGTDPSTYLGRTADLVSGATDRARTFLKENP